MYKGPFDHFMFYIGLSTDTKPTNVALGSRFFETDTRAWYIFDSSDWSIMPSKSSATMYAVTDPATNAAVATTVVNAYGGTVITLTGAGNTQTLQSPTIVTAGKIFTVVNNDTSTDNASVVANGTDFTVAPGKSQSFVWDGSAWGPTDLGITDIPVKVTQGGTGASTLTDHGVLLGSGTDPVTVLTPLAAGELLVGVGGADPHALAAGAATKILVGGGAGDPVWTEATGSDAPVRATSPTLVTPALGTPASGDLKNCSVATEADKGVTVYAGTTKALAGTDTASAMTPADTKAVLAAPGPIGGTTPAAGIFSPVKAKGPAIITTFAGTVTATASTTVTFSSAADAILAGYSATNPFLGTTLISNSLTRYIVSWTNATTCVVDSSVTWAGTAITSVQLPIATFVDSSGVVKGWMNAAGSVYFIDSPTFSAGATIPSAQTLYFYNCQIVESGGCLYIAAVSGDLIIRAGGITERVAVTSAGNLRLGVASVGTSAERVLVIGGGTMPTAPVADAVQIGVAEYNGATGDQRLNFYSEATVDKKAAIGSGTVSINGAVTSGGGFTRQLSETTSGVLSGATGSIAVNVPSGARILGVQLRVDTLITSGDGAASWTAAYVNTPTTAICSGQAFTANTKFNAIHPAYEITTGTVTITITPNANTFSGGVVRAMVYYEALDAMASL